VKIVGAKQQPRALVKRVYCAISRDTPWSRVVMDRETLRLVGELPVPQLDVLEISGEKWRAHPFRSYRSVGFPEYDICAGPLGETYDLVIAEQVLEHVARPVRAVENVYAMLRPGGALLCTTPFMVRVHPSPIDCTRWTETGIKYLLGDAGFDRIITGSWGNRACVRGNFKRFMRWMPPIHSLRNEPAFPVVVWALAHKDRSPLEGRAGSADVRQPRVARDH
jgi:SAM-dependent methyltransferase